MEETRVLGGSYRPAANNWICYRIMLYHLPMEGIRTQLKMIPAKYFCYLPFKDRQLFPNCVWRIRYSHGVKIMRLFNWKKNVNTLMVADKNKIAQMTGYISVPRKCIFLHCFKTLRSKNITVIKESFSLLSNLLTLSCCRNMSYPLNKISVLLLNWNVDIKTLTW